MMSKYKHSGINYERRVAQLMIYYLADWGHSIIVYIQASLR